MCMPHAALDARFIPLLLCCLHPAIKPVQVRLGQRMLIWRVAGGGLQLQFEEGEPATQPSGSGSGSTAQQHSTGRKRAAPE